MRDNLTNFERAAREHFVSECSFSDRLDSILFPRLVGSPLSGNSREENAKLLARMIAFVDAARSYKDLPISIEYSKGKWRLKMTRFARAYYVSIDDFIRCVDLLSENFRYDEFIDVFRQVSTELDLSRNGLSFRSAWVNGTINPALPHCRIYVALFNGLVARIRKLCRESNAFERRRLRLKEIGKRVIEFCTYVDNLFKMCARLVVVRVDFGYVESFRQEVSIKIAKRDLKNFLDNRRSNKTLMGGLRGYIWKVERSIQKGMHLHVLLFFDGSIRRQTAHIHLAKSVGEYWRNVITGGRGTYWNVNANVDRYKKIDRLGIGGIHATDEEKRANLNNYVIAYLCKSEQYVRPLHGSRERLIGRGQIRARKGRKPGPKVKPRQTQGTGLRLST